MRKFLAGVYIYDNQKKIAAIRTVRTVFGIGLLEAKNFVEQNNGATVKVILNAEQVAALMVFSTNAQELDAPSFYLASVKPIDSGLDFSADTPR